MSFQRVESQWKYALLVSQRDVIRFIRCATVIRSGTACSLRSSYFTGR